MKRLRKLITSLLVLVSIMALNPIGASAEWKQNRTGWWYAEGNSWATGWKQIDGKWYYFDSNGYMAKNTTISGYQLGYDGVWIANSNINETGEKGEFLNKLKANCGAEILDYYYNDFDKNGKNELLALTGVRDSYFGHGTSNGTLWLVNSNSVKIVDSQKVDYITAEVIDVGNAKHLSLYGNAGGPGTWFSIYEVKGNAVNTLYKNKNGSVAKADDGKLYYYTSAIDCGKEPNSTYYTGRSEKTYYVYYDGQYKEYGAIQISKEDFLNFEGGNDVWNSLEQELNKLYGNGSSTTSTILYRANGIININFNTITSTGGESQKNAIIEYKNNKVSIKNNEYGKLIRDGKVSAYGTPFVVTCPEFN